MRFNTLKCGLFCLQKQDKQVQGWFKKPEEVKLWTRAFAKSFWNNNTTNDHSESYSVLVNVVGRTEDSCLVVLFSSFYSCQMDELLELHFSVCNINHHHVLTFSIFCCLIGQLFKITMFIDLNMNRAFQIIQSQQRILKRPSAINLAFNI